MPRAKAILQSDYPYQISARCINREWFFLPMNHVWDIFCEELSATVREHSLLVHSFVLMSNHFHLIASTPEANISKSMWYFMNRTSRRLTRAGNRINESFAGRHYKCVLASHSYYLNAYKYNYRNPVAAGICRRVEEYSYSTIRWQMNPELMRFPMAEDTIFISDPVGTLTWLNTAPDPAKLKAVRCGLNRPVFTYKRRTDSVNSPMGIDELI